jgi:RNA polymerase sigma-70 factor (ECF subfamily)
MSNDQEVKLVTTAVAGDNEAFAILYKMYIHKIYAYCVVKVGIPQEAEDITEQVFVRALKNIAKFRQDSSFLTWIYTIARHLVIDFYRKKKLLPLKEEQLEANPEEKTSEEELDKKQKQVREILDKLPENYAKVLQLRFLQNQTVKETANILGISENNVKVRQVRALQKAFALSKAF